MMRLQKMSQGTGLLAVLEEDLGLSNLATKNDQRTCASLCHLELIRYELGFPDMLEEDFLVSHPGIPMRTTNRQRYMYIWELEFNKSAPPSGGRESCTGSDGVIL